MNFGGCGPTNYASHPCFGDSEIHPLSLGLGPRLTAAVQSTVTGSYNNTDLTMPFVGMGDSWDVRLTSLPLAGSTVGLYECEVYVFAGVCDRARIRFDADQVVAENFTDQELWALACHEIGHSVGLLHPTVPTQSVYRCMVQGYPKPNTVGPHNAAHLDDYY